MAEPAPADGPLPRSGAPGTTGWRSAPRPAVVESFDADVGLGVLRDAGGRRYPFHCTALSDGGRTVPVGAAVRFTVGAGHHGRLEADAVLVEPAGGDGVARPPG